MNLSIIDYTPKVEATLFKFRKQPRIFFSEFGNDLASF